MFCLKEDDQTGVLQNVSEEKLILVKYQPGYKVRRFFLFSLSVVAIALMGFIAGEAQIGVRYDAVVEERDQLLQELQQVSDSEQRLGQQVAILERGKAIDNQAQQEIQQTIRSLESEINSLKADVRFYQNIMAPSDASKGLQVQKLELSQTSDPRRFQYKLVLTQVANNKNYVSGVVAVNLIGSQNGKKAIIPLRDISDVKELGMKFRFRYFQDYDGELMLPEEFKPESVQVVAQSQGKKSVRAEATFPWQLKESKVDVGQN